MLHLQILSGKQAGVVFDSRRFPVHVGRGSGNDIRLEEEGVWEKHFEINLDAARDFVLTAHSGALLVVNADPVQSTALRNGDLITAGSVRIAFRLSETHQPVMRLADGITWLLIAGVTVAQIVILYWLLI